MLCVHSMDEVYTCNNPNTIAQDNIHLLCDWGDEDFINYPDGRRVLRPIRKKDNIIKAYYRRKHWYAKQKSKGQETIKKKKTSRDKSKEKKAKIVKKGAEKRLREYIIKKYGSINEKTDK